MLLVELFLDQVTTVIVQMLFPQQLSEWFQSQKV
jgi:hypothetical protein